MMTDTATVTAEHGIVATRLGELTVVRHGEQLTGVYFPHHWHRPDPATFGPRTSRGLIAVARQLGEYLAGARQEFDLPLRPRGTELQLRV
jgi:methylated-DNA-[protein]-cysteine S-methyltransferase